MNGTENPASTNRLMEEVCERENLKAAWRRVKANKGSPGVDGMTVIGIKDYLKQHWPAIREQGSGCGAFECVLQIAGTSVIVRGLLA
jgi:RNA-directed DNA polymerase